MMSQLKPHLPLIAVATASALVIFYLYRELQKAKRALVTERPEECTSALCKERADKPAKRVRFEAGAGSSSSQAADPPPPGVNKPDKAAARPDPPTAPGATPGDGAFDSKE